MWLAACGQRPSSGGPPPRPRSSSSTLRARIGPTPSRSWRSRNQLISSAGLSVRRSRAMKSLTCAASRKRSPPYLTNGIPRRVSSSSSGSESCPVRNRTACCAQLHALLARGHDAIADLPGLRRFIPGHHELRLDASLALTPQPLGEAVPVLCRDGVRDREDRAGRAVVALKGHRAAAREVLGEIQDVAGARGAEAVDRLEVVADDGQSGLVRRAGS